MLSVIDIQNRMEINRRTLSTIMPSSSKTACHPCGFADISGSDVRRFSERFLHHAAQTAFWLPPSWNIVMTQIAGRGKREA